MLRLILVLALLPLPATAASFDCSQRGLAADEAAICANRDLNDMDVEMAVTYRLLLGLFTMGTRHELQDAQAAWLRGRQACGGDVGCLRKAYRARIKTLQQLYEGIDRPI